MDSEQRGASRRWQRRLPWIVVPVCGALWSAFHLRNSYFFYDEWGLIARVMHAPPFAAMMATFNGHLWMAGYWIYRAQVDWFGVDDHTFVSAVLLASLIALHWSLARLFVAAGLSSLTSLLLAGLLTYPGRASQNFIFAFQAPSVLSLASAVAAAALALGRPPSIRRRAAASALLVAAVGFDSGIALVGVAFALVVLLREWRGAAFAAVAPVALAISWWLLAGDLGPRFSSSVAERAVFAGHLLLAAVGAPGGGGELVGGVLLAASAALVSLGLARGDVDRSSTTALLAGSFATAVAVAAITKSRAGIANFNFVDFNRYLQTVAIPAALALAPALASIGRARLGAGRLGSGAAAALLVAAFLCGLAPMLEYARRFEGWNVAVRRGVRVAAAVIRAGCPSGAAPDPRSQPLARLSPQISTQLLRELVERGALREAASLADAPEVVERMCPRPG